MAGVYPKPRVLGGSHVPEVLERNIDACQTGRAVDLDSGCWSVQSYKSPQGMGEWHMLAWQFFRLLASVRWTLVLYQSAEERQASDHPNPITTL